MPTRSPIRCPICDVPIDRLEYRNHLRSIHPSYEKNSRNALVALVIGLVIVVTSNFLLPVNDLILSLGAVGVVAVAAISTSYTLIGKRKFRHAWKEQNAEGTKSDTQ
jgi:O-antigen/teichoic acid export membrane protein